jgi:uncharacterized LabA/DUF88 family protein
MSAARRMRTNVYIDGFNLYYGCLKGTPYRWLDIRALCEGLFPGHQLNRIRYFTAKVSARPADPSQPARQEAYLRAIQTLPGVSVHLGHYLLHPVMMPLAVQPPMGSAMVRVLKSEEKGSDVNIASYLLLDAFKADYEQGVILSNDSDLKTPIEMVRTELNRPVGVVFPISRPGRRASQELMAVAKFQKSIRESLLARCQLPTTIAGHIQKPAAW